MRLFDIITTEQIKKQFKTSNTDSELNEQLQILDYIDDESFKQGIQDVYKRIYHPDVDTVVSFINKCTYIYIQHCFFYKLFIITV